MKDLFDMIFDAANPMFSSFYQYPYRYATRKEGDNTIFSVELPGISKEDVNVSYDKGEGTISIIIEKENYEKAWKLPKYNKVLSAEMKNGLLKIVIGERIPEDKRKVNVEIK